MNSEWFVYILESEINGSLYKGHTSDLSRRIKEHNDKKDKSTARYTPWKLIWFCSKSTKSEATILEYKLKNLSRKRLFEFINKYTCNPNVCAGPDVALMRKSGC